MNDQRNEHAQAPCDYQKLMRSIIYDPRSHEVVIGASRFALQPGIDPIVATKKVVYRLTDNGRVLKVVRQDARDITVAFNAMEQTISGEAILMEHRVPHLPIYEHDPEGPPYRYIIQQAVPEGSPSAAELILKGALTARDIEQLASYVNGFEPAQEYQLDTNPYNWFRLGQGAQSVLTYADGKVYPYEHDWRFSHIGLLQWIDPRYIQQARFLSPSIPTSEDYAAFLDQWKQGTEATTLWATYLDPALQPA